MNAAERLTSVLGKANEARTLMARIEVLIKAIDSLGEGSRVEFSYIGPPKEATEEFVVGPISLNPFVASDACKAELSIAERELAEVMEFFDEGHKVTDDD